MDLNSDIDEGLDSTAAPVDPSTLAQDPLVTAPNATPQKTEKVVIQTSADDTTRQFDQAITPDELFGPQPTEQPLPDLEAKLVLMQSQNAKVIDLREIATSIAENAVVSQEEAKMVDSVFGEFFHPRLSAKEFSHVPSKTHFSTTMKFVQNRIAKEEMELVNITQAFFDAPLGEVVSFKENFSEIYIPYLKAQFFKIESVFTNLFEALETSKNLIFPIGTEFIHILEHPIGAFDNSLFEAYFKENETTSGKLLLIGVDAVKGIIDNPAFVYFVKSVIENLAPIENEADLIAFAQSTPPLTIGDLVKFYQSKTALSRIELLETQLEEAVKTLSELKLQFQELQEDPIAINAFVLAKSDEIQAKMDQLHFVRNIASALLQMNHAAVQILQFLETCK